MLMPIPPFAIICIYPPGQSDPTPITVNGKLVIFDHAEQARNYIYLFGNSRETVFDTLDSVHWTPLKFDQPNRALIVTEYDPYNAPANWDATKHDGTKYRIRSETHGMEWKHHIHAAYVFEECGQVDTDKDGVHTNLALL